MPVDPVLASYGDLTYGTALVLYLLAMVIHAVGYAAGRVPIVATAQRTQGAGDGPVATLIPPETSLEDPRRSPRPRSASERLGRCAVALTVLAALVHASSLALRGAATGRVPWANMYEFISAICIVAVISWLVVLYRQR
ncbi:MAG: c-type cytochrome biogenesis protein CcsB, partial [Pseudonocardiaceae bacterium]